MNVCFLVPYGFLNHSSDCVETLMSGYVHQGIVMGMWEKGGRVWRGMVKRPVWGWHAYS